jgi:hypothetical protein
MSPIMAMKDLSIAAIIRSANGPSASSSMRVVSADWSSIDVAMARKMSDLVAEQEVERRTRHLGGAGDVVHRGAREAVAEEDAHRAVEDAGALRLDV